MRLSRLGIRKEEKCVTRKYRLGRLIMYSMIGLDDRIIENIGRLRRSNYVGRRF